jgi:hypothetical protein
MTARQFQIVDGVQDQIWTIGPANSAGIFVCGDGSLAGRDRSGNGPSRPSMPAARHKRNSTSTIAALTRSGLR